MDNAEFDQSGREDGTPSNGGGSARFGPHGAPEMQSEAVPPASLRGRLSPSAPTPSAVFTGRETELRQLHDALQREVSVLTPVPRVLHGPGGVGKTQIAARYAHDHRAAFDGVFWVNGDTPDALQSQLASLAPELVSPVPTLPDQNATFQAVLEWFAAHTDWLLVVDNAAHLPELNPLLPHHPTGLVLLTTREPVPPGFGQCLPIGHLDEITSATLLLRRAKTLAPDASLNAADATTQAGAKQLSAELNGLPLALDQAGALLAQQNIVPQKYLALCQARILRLPCAYTDPDRQAVAVTTSLALEQMKRTPRFGRYAAELALFAAFLGSDTLPKELILRGKSVPEGMPAWFSDDALNINEVTATVCAYGLLRPSPDPFDPSALWMHRLTRDALYENQPAEAQRDGMSRFVLAIEAAFSWPEPAHWPLCEQLIPHALRCEAYIAQSERAIPHAAHLLEKMAEYRQQRLRYEDALRLHKATLRVTRLMYDDDHANVRTALGNVERLCRALGHKKEATSYLEEANALRLRLQEMADALRNRPPDKDKPGTVRRLNTQGVSRVGPARPDEAIAQRLQALDTARRTHGSNHPDAAVCLNSLAVAYTSTQRYAEAEPLLTEALSIDRQTIGNKHPAYATHLVNLAAVYIKWGRAHEAESLLAQALAIRERTHGPEHPEVATCHYWQGRMCHVRRNLSGAAAAFRRAWEVREHVLRPQHPDTLTARSWLDGAERELSGEGG